MIILYSVVHKALWSHFLSFNTKLTSCKIFNKTVLVRNEKDIYGLFLEGIILRKIKENND